MPAVKRGKVCILGAGGPVGAVVYPLLSKHYELRLADIATLAEVMGRAPSSTWPSWNHAPSPRDSWHTCDVTDLAQVDAVVEGCDAVINLTVNRSDTALAFQINVGGAYNVMKAAARHLVKRVVHSGPWARVNGYEGDYRYEYGIPAAVPYRAGTLLYPHTKGLSLHVVNAFAEHCGVDTLTLWLSRLRPADAYDGRDDDVLMSFSVSWQDLARAFLCALQAPQMPEPNEEFFICAKLPMDKYRPHKAERLLGWRAEDTFEKFYSRNQRPCTPS